MKKINGLFYGFLYGILSSASFGLIPLFAIPAMQGGMDFMNVLVYRFLFATISLAILLKLRHISFGIGKRNLPVLLLLAILYLMSAVFLLWGYEFMPSGIATTIHFMYPVITTLIMILFFRERNSIWRSAAIALAISGVYILSNGDTNSTANGNLSTVGIIIVLLSAIGYALYLVTVGQKKNKDLQGLRLTFYVFFIGTVILTAGMGVTGNLHPIPDIECGVNLLLLAIIPTVVSNLALIEAIKRIGPTQTSVLGAMEPVTAVIVGILVFQEAFSASIALGIALIISAVTIIIVNPRS